MVEHDTLCCRTRWQDATQCKLFVILTNLYCCIVARFILCDSVTIMCARPDLNCPATSLR